ncbi:translocase of chloroplast 159, chloroplastic-like isoform X1 [Cucurbita maxima]|uniref:Translocase of chloroplast 159, chloroplastic-like isoform X1 n=2 Tax=Cucurbita maxima TaxID=3661 RepID=A0A6J1J406_CUCMA|nr:translocase of chloroplast 159, chloroplastic-like isoform X1 [Cucurbita maxima]
MESKDLSQEPSLQNSAFSGSSSTYSSSFSSSSVDSNVDMPSREMEVSEIKTSVGGDGDGSDGGGSETEGFLSGEEEFESAFDRPIVEYPEEESFGNSIKGGDSGRSFVSCSEFSASGSVRPTAKISVDSDVEEEDDGLQVDESLGRNEEIDDKVDGEDFVDSKGNEIEIPVEKEETLVSGGNADVSDVVNEGDASQVYERTFELSGNTKESDVPESSIAEDVGSVFEETANGEKQVSEEDELNDVTVEQRQNEASKGGKEAELNKESPMTEKQADEGIGLNEKVVAEIVEQLKEQESPGSSSDDKADLGDKASSKLSKLADGKQEAETEKGSLMAENQADGEVELNDKVAAEDGEQLKNLETGSPVDDKPVLGDDEISKFIKLADGGQVEIDKGSPVVEMQADGIILNDMEDAEDGEQLPKLESGSSVDSKDDQDDQANSKVAELENSYFLELADGEEEAEMDKGSSVAEMQADRKIILNEMENAEDGKRLPKLESGSSVDSKDDQDDQANSKVAELENSEFLELADEGEEAEMDKGSSVAMMQADRKTILNEMEDAEDGEQLPKLESGSSVDSKADQDDQANSKVAELENSKFLEVADGGKEAEVDKGSPVAEIQADGEILNDKEDAEDGEQFPKLEPGSSVDSKADQDDQANSKVAELADEFTDSVLDNKILHESSLVSVTAAVGNPEEIKDVGNRETADLENGAAKLDNGFDNVGHETDDSVDLNSLVSNPEIDNNMLEVSIAVAAEEAVSHGDREIVASDIAKNENLAAMDVEDQQPDEQDSKYDSKIREDLPGKVEPKPSQEARSLVKESIPDNASVIDSGISDVPEALKPVLNEVDGAKHPLDEEGDIEGSVTDGETEGEIFGSSEAAREFMEELERASGAGFHSGAESSIDQSQRIDGQIVTDSDEADTDDEGDGKELFDSAALAALLKAARDAGSDGGPITVTSQDGSRLFSIERPAGLGSSLVTGKNASRPSRPLSFTPANPRVGDDSENKLSEEEKSKLQKLQQKRVNFLRLVQRLGVSPDDSLVAQVLYRFGLVAGRSTGQLFSFDNAKNTAMQLEAEGKEDLDFSLNILVLGKSGVGKSATINSIFGEDKTPINAFGPGTTSVKEIIGTVEGVKIRIFDSPGLRSSSSERRINHRILSSIKNVMKKFPPDIVLYVDRLDNQTRDLNDLLLLRSVSSYLGSSVWKNAIITLTHAASAPPDGPSGSPLGYEVFVAQRSHVLQQTVAQAVGDLRILNPTLMNPVSLVENHPSCRKNRDGQKVLPNGQSWRPQLLLLCFSIKVLAEVGNLSKAPETFDHRKLFGLRSRSPPLPYLLSGLLQSRTHPKLPSDQNGDNGDSDIDLAELYDSDQEEEEDEYDQLPPFKPLRKSQVSKLSKEQRKAYFEEYDYRVKLLQKKQWKEELKRMRDMKKGQQPTVDDYGYMGEDDQENGGPAAVQVPLPDMALPPSFDGDNPAYRFRFLEPTSQFLARPVLDTHGWDHDCGYDGVNLEHSMAIVSRFPAAVAVQITKDKKEFNIHLDSSISAKHGENGSTMAGFDIQNIGRQLAYILRGETKFKNFRKNKTAAGVSVTFLGENVCPGFKVEDQITLGKRVVLVGSTGTVRSQGDSAFGANLEMRLREADFPIGQDQSSLGLSLVKWRGDTALGANFQSQFSVGRSYKMAVRAGINNKLSGQISVKTSSSDQLQIALLALLPVARAIYNSLRPGVAEHYSAY